MNNSNRIDVHHHVLPKFYIDAQKSAGITSTAYRGFPHWTPEHSLALMENEDIATAVLSFTSPGIWFGKIAQTRDLAQRCNDYLADLVAKHPSKFGGFAFLPLPDIDAALKEIARVYEELKLDGITLLTSVDEKYIGHPVFEPIYAELDHREAVVFIHPCYPPGTEAEGWDIPRMLIDYPFETTRVAVNLILKGVLNRFPNIKFVLSHAGGTLPFLSHRISIFDDATSHKENYPEGANFYIKRFWFDTALSANSIPLNGLESIADPSKILFGSDYPYISEDKVHAETTTFDTWKGFTNQLQTAINRKNAESLLPRLSKL